MGITLIAVAYLLFPLFLVYFIATSNMEGKKKLLLLAFVVITFFFVTRGLYNYIDMIIPTEVGRI